MQLGWRARVVLEDDVQRFLRENPRQGVKREKRVLVFSTTFHPVVGIAEEALCTLMQRMPDVHFDIVTTAFSKAGKGAACPVANATVHRVGYGTSYDKYLLPILGARTARALHAQHRYLFTWSLLASYAALAALIFKRTSQVPLLITLADQNFDRTPSMRRFISGFIMRSADQVYAREAVQEDAASKIARRLRMRNSMGEGDAFANQIRFTYAEILAEPRT
jgi:hypothetical protein